MAMATRPRLAPTDDWPTIQLRFAWPEQRAYELIRPVVLFGRTVQCSTNSSVVHCRFIPRFLSGNAATGARRSAEKNGCRHFFARRQHRPRVASEQGRRELGRSAVSRKQVGARAGGGLRRTDTTRSARTYFALGDSDRNTGPTQLSSSPVWGLTLLSIGTAGAML